jgi:hypothetical protein
MIGSGERMPGVFITYSTDARKWAEKLAAGLKAEGIETRADFEMPGPDQDWRRQVEQALEAADVYLFVVGARHHRDPAQDRQWQNALVQSWTDSTKRIIPVLVGQAEAPPFLQNWQAVRIEPGQKASDVVKQLAKMVAASPASLRRRPSPPGKEWLDRLRLIKDVAERWKAEQSPAVKPEP